MAKKGTKKCGDCEKYYPEETMGHYRGGVSKENFVLCRDCQLKRNQL